jgi:hypothetical protein
MLKCYITRTAALIGTHPKRSGSFILDNIFYRGSAGIPDARIVPTIRRPIDDSPEVLLGSAFSFARAGFECGGGGWI